MKIAFVALHLDTKGGTQRQSLALARAMKKLGHEVTIYTLEADYEKCYGDMMRGLDIRVVPTMPRQKTANIFKRKLQSKRYFDYVAREIANVIDSRVDFLCCQDEESYKVGYYFRMRKEKPHANIAWTMNDPPVSYRPKSTLLLEIARRLFNVFDLWYERPFLGAIDTIFVLDKRNRELVKTFYKRDDAIILGAGVDFDYFYAPVRRLDPQKPIHILGVGIFARYRRFEDIIEAAAILMQSGVALEVNILGDVEGDLAYADELRHTIARLDLEKMVRLRGKVSESDLLRFYRESDIFIFPNHMQTFGLAPAEAMAAGLLVIVSKTAGFSEFVKDGEEALLVDPLRPDQIAEDIASLLKNPPFAEEVALGGQRAVKERLSWTKKAEEMIRYTRGIHHNP